MTEKDKQLLLKDLCSRVTDGVKVKIRSNDIRTVRGVDVIESIVHFVENDTISPFGLHILHPIDFRQQVKPYLRPMSSMTDAEKRDYQYITERWMYDASYSISDSIDWLNTHHFDYRGLIEMGLALEATEGMYK